ncbi:MAG: hypothetical protein MI700_04370 [Balneolales bacterium]|nr:hypothetical protein [Balneolales bacterium]
MQKQLAVVNSNIYFIQQGIELLNDINDELYSKNNGPYHKSGIGRHFRHIIEHYFSLVGSYSGLIDYDARNRNLRLENDREYMIQSLLEVVQSLQTLNTQQELLDVEIEVRSNEGVDEENSPLSKSSIRRELQFLISHTVHHYALIGLILKTLGYNPSEDFGVAPSTLKYEQEQGSPVKAS